jgi:hypothetical protein
MPPSSVDAADLPARAGLRPEDLTTSTYTDKAQECQILKERLAAAFRLFAKYGFDEGVGTCIFSVPWLWEAIMGGAMDNNSNSPSPVPVLTWFLLLELFFSGPYFFTGKAGRPYPF